MVNESQCWFCSVNVGWHRVDIWKNFISLILILILHIFTISLISYPNPNTFLHSLLSPYPILYLNLSSHPLSILHLSISIPIPLIPLSSYLLLLSYTLYYLTKKILLGRYESGIELRIELRTKDWGSRGDYCLSLKSNIWVWSWMFEFGLKG